MRDHLGLVLGPGSFTFGLAQLLLHLVVQQRVVLVERHYLVFAGIQQLCDYFLLESQTPKSILPIPHRQGRELQPTTFGTAEELLLLFWEWGSFSRSGVNV